MLKCKKFTFTDLVVLLFIVVIFAVMLPPFLANAARIGKGTQCKANLKKCYNATIAYMNDHNEIRVNDASSRRHGQWGRVLFSSSYLKNRKVMNCPNDRSVTNLDWSKTYGSLASKNREINMKAANYSKVAPSQLLIFADSFRCDDTKKPRRSIYKLKGNSSGLHCGIVTFMHQGNKAGVITYDGSAKMASGDDFAGAPPVYVNAKIVLEHMSNKRYRAIRRVQNYTGSSYLVTPKAIQTKMAEKNPLPLSSAVKRGILSYKGKNCNGYKVLNMWQCPMPDPKEKNSGYKQIPGVKRALIYKGNWENGGYNHHSNFLIYKGVIYASWSNQPYGEDCPGQRVLYATSKDGLTWSKTKELFPPPSKVADQTHRGSFLASRGFFVWNGRLFGRASGHKKLYWENKERTSKSSSRNKKHRYPYTLHYCHIVREVKPDGSLGKIFSIADNSPPASYSILKKSQVVPKLRIPRNGLKNLRLKGADTQRLTEATPYKTKDGKFAVLFRDDSYSHRKYASFSEDGKTWPTAQPTNIPDSPSFSIGLSGTDGSVLFFGNHMAPQFDIPSPRHYGRDPLMITYSPDGYKLTKSYAISSGPHKYTIPREKVFGRGGGAQYPAAVVANGKVYVMYSSGKEDIIMSVFTLSSIGISSKVIYKRIR